jgi:hypothetical protein
MRRLLDLNLLYLIPLLLSAVFSLRVFMRKWPKLFKVFSIFLWITAFFEFFAVAWVFWLHKKFGFNYYNHWIYGALITIRHLFLLYFFFNILNTPSIKKLIKQSVIPVVAFAIINYAFIQTPFALNSYTMIITSLITILLCMAFFYQILKDERIIELSKSTEVWIVSGSFLYYATTLPLFIIFNFLVKENALLMSSFYRINDLMNLIMYSSYIIAFLCKPHSPK